MKKHLLKIIMLIAIIAFAIRLGGFLVEDEAIAGENLYNPSNNLVTVEGKRFIAPDGSTLRFRGVNLGQWLVLEGYLWNIGPHDGQTYHENYPEHEVKRRLDSVLSSTEETTEAFMEKYRENFLIADDIQYLKSIGVNLVRIPFDLRDETAPTYLSKALTWCKEYQIYCLFDVHVALEPQSTLPHADSKGEATFWNNKSVQEQTTQKIVEIISEYSGYSYLLGIDILNEPQAPNNQDLQAWYRDTIKALRESGFQHLIFVQPNNVSVDIESILQTDTGVVYEPHYYGYGGNIYTENQPLFDAKDKHNVPVIIGEYGNWANDWWAKYTDRYTTYNYLNQDISVIYWTYKDMIADNIKSFGLVRGDTGDAWQTFRQYLDEEKPLPDSFEIDTLYQTFQTVFPTDRPHVVELLHELNPDQKVKAYESREQVKNILENADDSDLGDWWYRRNSDRVIDRIWNANEMVKHCVDKTVEECFYEK